MNQRRRFRRTTLVSAGLLAFLVGLFAAKSVHVDVGLLTALMSLPLLFVFRKRALLLLAVVCLSGLLLGLWRGNLTKQAVAWYGSWIGQSVVIEGRVLDDPVYDDRGRLDFRLGSVEVNETAAIGQIRVKAHVNGVRRGDHVQAAGTLQDGFGNYQASIYYGTAQVVAPTTSYIEKLRREFFASVYSVLPEPQASLGLGFLVGLRSALPEEFDEQLRIAGLTHIVVASGYNLTILVRLSRRLLAKYSKYQALMGSLVLILAFLAVTGASPSMVRASVVTVLSLIAWYYGRKFQPVLIILLGAGLTAGYNPLYIWYDLGWWLSFLAFAGVLIIAPLLAARMYGEKSPPLLVQVAIETLSAQAMATPLILFTFGELSLVALFANVAVVPLIPFAMIGTFVAGVAGIVLSPVFAAWLAVPGNLILRYIVEVTQLFASVPWAKQTVDTGWVVMLFLYAVIGLGTWVLYKTSHKRFSQLPGIVE